MIESKFRRSANLGTAAAAAAVEVPRSRKMGPLGNDEIKRWRKNGQ